MALNAAHDEAALSAAVPDREHASAANRSFAIDRAGWKEVFVRVLRAFNRDRVALIAAGATFYLLLAVFPALAVMVSVFGLVTDPYRISGLFGMLHGVVPASAIDIVDNQLDSLASQGHAALSLGFAFGLLFALWSATSGIKTLFEAMNIAYEETEKRSFVRLNLLALVGTVGAMLLSLVVILGVGVMPIILAGVGYSGSAPALIAWLRWPAVFFVSASGIALLYRYGPSRSPVEWRRVLWASVVAAAVWLATAILFSWYLASFANYNATYGSLGAIIGFMMWTWVSMVVLIVGAELAAAAEDQPSYAQPATTPESKPAVAVVQVAAGVAVLAVAWLAGSLMRQ